MARCLAAGRACAAMLLMHEAPGGRVNAKAPLTIVVQEAGHHLVCILLDPQSRVLVFCSTGSFFFQHGSPRCSRTR
eukprot:1136445-Prorocentrum_lima.AAC.1